VSADSVQQHTMNVSPEPTDEEAAAIVAALETTRRPVVAGSDASSVSRWRWSGRWWTKPIPLRRNRPW
jgi:hypothetical protein